MPNQSQEIAREFNRRIFINQMKQERDAADDLLNRVIIRAGIVFLAISWAYLVYRMFDALARLGV